MVATAGLADRLSNTNCRTSAELRTAICNTKSSAPPKKNNCCTPGFDRISDAKVDIRCLAPGRILTKINASSSRPRTWGFTSIVNREITPESRKAFSLAKHVEAAMPNSSANELLVRREFSESKDNRRRSNSSSCAVRFSPEAGLFSIRWHRLSLLNLLTLKTRGIPTRWNYSIVNLCLF